MMSNKSSQADQEPSQPDPNRKEDVIYVIRLSPRVFCCCLLLLTILLSFPVIFISYKIYPWKPYFDPDIVHNIGVDGLVLFRQYDRDDDGYLSFEEYEPLAHLLNDVNITKPFDYYQAIDADDEVFTIYSYFKPLNLSSMDKETDSLFNGMDSLHYLKNWKYAAKLWENFGVKQLKIFLPPSGHGVGDVYDMLPSRLDNGATLSNNRYYPPKVHDDDVTIHRLLAMFHPQAFICSRFQPQGSNAVVRATSQHYLDIYFRIHGEFQLNKPPFFPFWFTPAQFTGHLIISRNMSHLMYFNLYVPTEKQLNVDMEWLNGPGIESMEVDIGFLPQMELRSVSPSVRAYYEHSDDHVHGYYEHSDDHVHGYYEHSDDHVHGYYEHSDDHVHDVRGEEVMDMGVEEYNTLITSITWHSHITEAEAMAKLATDMYPFQEVPYHPLPEALDLATLHHRPIHSLTLWGSLDDQSC